MLSLLETQAADVNEQAGAAFDRVGARAWSLAVWIVRDEQRAADILVAAFSRLPGASTGDARGDASLLCEVRRRAMVATGALAPAPASRSQPDSGSPRSRVETRTATLRAAIVALPERERECLELAVFGQLTATAIASATTTPCAEVLSFLADAMSALHPRAKREQALGVGRPSRPNLALLLSNL